MNLLEDRVSDFFLELKRIKFLAPKVNRGIQFVFVINGELTVEMNSRFYNIEKKDTIKIIHQHAEEAPLEEQKALWNQESLTMLIIFLEFTSFQPIQQVMLDTTVVIRLPEDHFLN